MIGILMRRPVGQISASTIGQQKMSTACFFYLTLFVAVLTTLHTANAQAAAWPATSYSPYFQSLFAEASAPVAAIPSGPGAQAPSIPIPGPPVVPNLAQPLPPNGAFATPVGYAGFGRGILGAAGPLPGYG